MTMTSRVGIITSLVGEVDLPYPTGHGHGGGLTPPTGHGHGGGLNPPLMLSARPPPLPRCRPLPPIHARPIALPHSPSRHSPEHPHPSIPTLSNSRETQNFTHSLSPNPAG